jgi:hypothetical protein
VNSNLVSTSDVVNEFGKLSGLRNPDFEAKPRPNGNAIIIRIAEPSERFFQAALDVSAAAESSDMSSPNRSTSTVSVSAMNSLLGTHALFPTLKTKYLLEQITSYMGAEVPVNLAFFCMRCNLGKMPINFQLGLICKSLRGAGTRE